MIEELQTARRLGGWSQRTLAGRIGVDAQAIKRLENGIGSVPALIAVMTGLDLRLNTLGTGKIGNRLRRIRAQGGQNCFVAAISCSGLAVWHLPHFAEGSPFAFRLPAVADARCFISSTPGKATIVRQNPGAIR